MSNTLDLPGISAKKKKVCVLISKMVWELRFTQKFDIFIQSSHLFVEDSKVHREMLRVLKKKNKVEGLILPYF